MSAQHYSKSIAIASYLLVSSCLTLLSGCSDPQDLKLESQPKEVQGALNSIKPEHVGKVFLFKGEKPNELTTILPLSLRYEASGGDRFVVLKYSYTTNLGQPHRQGSSSEGSTSRYGVMTYRHPDGQPDNFVSLLPSPVNKLSIALLFVSSSDLLLAAKKLTPANAGTPYAFQNGYSDDVAVFLTSNWSQKKMNGYRYDCFDVRYTTALDSHLVSKIIVTPSSETQNVCRPVREATWDSPFTPGFINNIPVPQQQ